MLFCLSLGKTAILGHNSGAVAVVNLGSQFGHYSDYSNSGEVFGLFGDSQSTSDSYSEKTASVEVWQAFKPIEFIYSTRSSKP